MDTHALIWLYTGNERLSEKAKNVIEDSENEYFLSLASLWEMAIKIKLDKMDLGVPLDDFIKDVIENGIQLLDISLAHILKTQELEFHHRDPFDRLIIAQAIVENMALVSVDEVVDLYLASEAVKRIW